MSKHRGVTARERTRRASTRRPVRRILVLCEGEVTEPGYFRALRAALRNPLVDIEVEGRGEGPKTLVERAALRKKTSDRHARKERDAYLAYDEIWCVFDVDEHAKLADARQQARDNGIELAVSNPCFELWALLHFQSQTAFLERHTARIKLKEHLPAYDKSLPFERLWPGYIDAVRRATHLERRCEERGCPGDNPSTGVHRLTERMGGARLRLTTAGNDSRHPDIPPLKSL